MSALTKVFVVLHVVVSMLLVAGMVVFVNKVEDANQNARTAMSALSIEKSAHLADTTRYTLATAGLEKARTEAATHANALAAEATRLAGQITDLQGQINTLTAAQKVAQTQLTTAQDAVKVAQDTNGAQLKVNNDLRNQNEDVEKKYTDSQIALSDVNNRLDAANTELRYAKENSVALQKELAIARKQLVDKGGSAAPGTPAVAPGVTPVSSGQTGNPVPPAVAIRGVVKGKFQVGDVLYATVALGTADGVQKGTRFNVTDPTGQHFLGYLTVDSVGANESSGHLSGPNVGAVQQGSEVLTSWQ